MNSLSLKKANALVIVAHPDDEIIWMGGALIIFKNITWTVFCLTRNYDPDRAPRFRRICITLNVRGIISDLEDEGLLNIRESVPEIKKRVVNELPRRRFDYIFTHGANGEYGHPRHKAVHQAVKDLLRTSVLNASEAYAFSYKPHEIRPYAIGDPAHADCQLRLQKTVFMKKRRLVEAVYGFGPQSFEYKSSRNKEYFRRLKP